MSQEKNGGGQLGKRVALRSSCGIDVLAERQGGMLQDERDGWAGATSRVPPIFRFRYAAFMRGVGLWLKTWRLERYESRFQVHCESKLFVVEKSDRTAFKAQHGHFAVSDDEHKDAHAHDPLTVLLRTHSASIYVHVGVDFYRGDLEPRGLKEQAGG